MNDLRELREIVDESADGPEDGCGEKPGGGWTCSPWQCNRPSECLLNGFDDEPACEDLDSGEQDRHRPDGCDGCTYLPGPDWGVRVSSSPRCPVHGDGPVTDVLVDVAELRAKLGALYPTATADWADTVSRLNRIEAALRGAK